jgi:hypothetical protein
MDSIITMEDVFRDWDAKIAKTIAGAGIPYSEVDDVKGDIYLSMVRRDICGKYDSSRAGSFSTYLYKVVHSMVSNHFRNCHRKLRIPKDRITNIGTDRFDDSHLFSEITHAYCIMDDIEQADFINSILLEIEAPERNKIFVSSDGREVSIKEVVSRLFSGQSLKGISTSLGIEVGRLTKALKFLKRVRWVSEYRTVAVNT